VNSSYFKIVLSVAFIYLRFFTLSLLFRSDLGAFICQFDQAGLLIEVMRFYLFYLGAFLGSATEMISIVSSKPLETQKERYFRHF